MHKKKNNRQKTVRKLNKTNNPIIGVDISDETDDHMIVTIVCFDGYSFTLG